MGAGLQQLFVIYYHNVLDGPLDDLDRRCSRLSLDSFRKQMEFLRTHLRPVSLDELLARARARDYDPACVAVTFDDAYEGVGRCAAPVLAELKIPATVFVVTGTLRRPDQPLHYEELELALRRSQVEYLECPELGLKPMKITSDRGRALSLKKLKPSLKTVPDSRRAKIHGDILKHLKVNPASLGLTPASRKLGLDDLRSLNRSELWEIGGHTQSHRVLAQLSVAEAAGEIRGCRDDLRELLGTVARFFAYPYGKAIHIGETPALVREAGFEAAFTTESGSLGEPHESHRIPRLDFIDLMARQPPSIQKKAREFFFG